MRSLLLASAAAALLLGACGQTGDSASQSGGHKGPAAQVSQARLLAANDAVNAGQWMSYGRDYSEQRFSPLKQVNADTVIKLGLAWFADLSLIHI